MAILSMLLAWLWFWLLRAPWVWLLLFRAPAARDDLMSIILRKI